MTASASAAGPRDRPLSALLDAARDDGFVGRAAQVSDFVAALAVAGRAYETTDPGWRMSCALMAGARSDPVLVRAYARIASLLALPAEALTAPDVQARVWPFLAAPRYPRRRPRPRRAARSSRHRVGITKGRPPTACVTW